MALSDAEIAGAARAAGFTGNDVAIAVAIALAESGGNPDATHRNVNGSTDYGVWQINSVHKGLLAGGNWRDPNSNARMARAVQQGSWRPWSSYNSGRYLRFLARGRAVAGTSTAAPSAGPDPSTAVGAAVDPSAGLAFFTNPGLWARIGVFLVGILFTLFGVWKITGTGGKLVSVAKTAVKARTGVSL